MGSESADEHDNGFDFLALVEAAADEHIEFTKFTDAETFVYLSRRQTVSDASQRLHVLATLKRSVVAVAAGAGDEEDLAPQTPLFDELLQLCALEQQPRLDAPHHAAGIHEQRRRRERFQSLALLPGLRRHDEQINVPPCELHSG